MIGRIDMCTDMLMDMPAIGRNTVMWDGGDGRHAERESETVHGTIREVRSERVGEIDDVPVWEWEGRSIGLLSGDIMSPNLLRNFFLDLLRDFL